MSSYKPQIFAHRGSSKEAPENTFPAFKLALTQSDGFECDIQLTKDKIPVLWHDDDLKKLNLPGKSIRDLAWPQLKQLNAAKLLPGYNKDAQLYRLEDALMSFSHKTSLLLEIKEEPNAPEKHRQRKVEETIKLIQCLILPDNLSKIFISSFNTDILLRAHQLYPQGNFIINHDSGFSRNTIESYYTKMPFLKGICAEIDQHCQLAKKCADEFNWLTCSYTCNTKMEIQKALELKVDILITDTPAQTKEVINSLN